MKVVRFVNELMSSNCYVVSDEESGSCIIIDPASEECGELIEYIERKKLCPLYVFLTHEHTDHTWGCNKLIDTYGVKIVASAKCKEALPHEGRVYFQFYYDDPSYTYAVRAVDLTTEGIGGQLDWAGRKVEFFHTPGHSEGSVCIQMENCLFTGDTLMQCKPFISRKSGAVDLFLKSVETLMNQFSPDTIVYPGHGESFLLKKYDKKWLNSLTSKK